MQNLQGVIFTNINQRRDMSFPACAECNNPIDNLFSNRGNSPCQVGNHFLHYGCSKVIFDLGLIIQGNTKILFFVGTDGIKITNRQTFQVTIRTLSNHLPDIVKKFNVISAHFGYIKARILQTQPTTLADAFTAIETIHAKYMSLTQNTRPADEDDEMSSADKTEDFLSEDVAPFNAEDETGIVFAQDLTIEELTDVDEDEEIVLTGDDLSDASDVDEDFDSFLAFEQPV